MIQIVEHVLDFGRQWQTVAMHNGAKPLAPFFIGNKLFLPCIEDTEAKEVGERILVVQGGEDMSEVQSELAYVGRAICVGFDAAYIFIEVEDGSKPMRRITHPGLIAQMEAEEAKELRETQEESQD